MKIVTLEEDRYLLTIPMESVVDQLVNSEECLSWLFPEGNTGFYFFKKDWKDGNPRTKLCSYSAAALTKASVFAWYNDSIGTFKFYNSTSRSFQTNRGSNKRSNVLFCLIPLTKDGQIDQSMKLIPNGEQVTFAQLTSDTQPLKSGIMHYCRKGQVLDFEDSNDPDYQMRWVWLNGMLVGGTGCITTSIDHLLDEGIVPTVAPLGESAEEHHKEAWHRFFGDSLGI